MTRREYMNRLESCLTCIEKSEREAALRYYEEYFDDAGVQREEEVIASLGAPETLAREIITGAGDGAKSGQRDHNAQQTSGAGEFHSIKAHLVNANFAMHRGTGYAVDINYPEGTEAPRIAINDGVLTIDEERRQFTWNLFRHSAWQPGRIDVTVPDAAFHEISIENINGRVELPNIRVNSAHCNTVNGAVSFEGTEADALHGESVNGNVSMRGCKVRERAHGETVNGTVTIGGELHGKTHVEAVNGALAVSTTLPAVEYDIDIKAVSGSLRVDGEKYKKEFHMRRGSGNSIKAESINGSVTLNFGV